MAINTTSNTDRQCMLTTIDNPWNYFTNFDEWYAFDSKEKKYNSLSYLARIAKPSDELSDADYNAEIERAIDEIITIDPFNLYAKQYSDEDRTPYDKNNDSNNG